MNHTKAVFAAIIISAGSAVSCAAADMPSTDEPAAMERPPLRLQYTERHAERSVDSVESVAHERVACNAFGRCFRVGPYARAFGPVEVYPGPRVYAPPVYEVPDYQVRRSFRERRFADSDFEDRGPQVFRRPYGEPRYGAPRGEDRRTFGYGPGDDRGPHERWSREGRRFEEGGAEPD